MPYSMIERCGGMPRLGKIVASFYDKVLSSSTLSRHFGNSDLVKLIVHQTKYIAALLGGAPSLTDDELQKAHQHLDITSSDFQEMASLLEATLQEFDIEQAVIEHLCREVLSREHLIVRTAGV